MPVVPNIEVGSEVKLSTKSLLRVCELIYALAGISIDASKQQLVRSRLLRRLHATKTPTFEAYLQRYIEPYVDPNVRAKAAPAQKAEVTQFVDALCTNLTSFFREKVHFDLIRDSLMPRLFKAHADTRRIRLWNAGCSTGEEPYTLAMTVLESLEKFQQTAPPAMKGGWDIKILATDISTKVLQTAMTGVYPASRTTGIPPQLKGKYLVPRRMPDGSAALAMAEPIRRLITFRHLNLMEPFPFNGRFDAIMCRNVMIYFDKPTQTKLVNKFHNALEQGGLFFTGHSESLTGIRHPFTSTQATVYQRTRAA